MMSAPGEVITREKVQDTLRFLRACKARKAAGVTVSYTDDPEWLLNMAINRRAGWIEHPHVRGAVDPRLGHYPWKAEHEDEAWRLSRDLNTPRLIVRAQSIGRWRRVLLARLPQRITTERDN